MLSQMFPNCVKLLHLNVLIIFNFIKLIHVSMLRELSVSRLVLLMESLTLILA